VNVHLIVVTVLVIVLATKMPWKMQKVKGVTIATVKKWKVYVLTTSVATTVADIRTTATVLATKMPWKMQKMNAVTIATVKKWGCVLTTSVATTVADIRTTATVLAIKMPCSLINLTN